MRLCLEPYLLRRDGCTAEEGGGECLEAFGGICAGEGYGAGFSGIGTFGKLGFDFGMTVEVVGEGVGDGGRGV